MEHIAALLLMIGCSGDLRQCHELPAPATVYETMEECNADLPTTLRDLGSAMPKVFGRCLFVDPAMEEEDAELTWNVTPAGELVASVGVPDVVMAASEGDHVQQ